MAAPARLEAHDGLRESIRRATVRHQLKKSLAPAAGDEQRHCKTDAVATCGTAMLCNALRKDELPVAAGCLHIESIPMTMPSRIWATRPHHDTTVSVQPPKGTDGVPRKPHGRLREALSFPMPRPLQPPIRPMQAMHTDCRLQRLVRAKIVCSTLLLSGGESCTLCPSLSCPAHLMCAILWEMVCVQAWCVYTAYLRLSLCVADRFAKHKYCTSAQCYRSTAPFVECSRPVNLQLISTAKHIEQLSSSGATGAGKA